MGDEYEARAAWYGGRPVKTGVVGALIAVIFFVAGMYVEAHADAGVFSNISLFGDGLDSTPDESADLADFWKAWNTLDTAFVETHASSTIPTMEERIQGAIAGLAASYKDPYTVYFPPAEAKMFEDDISGNFGGVGMELGIDQNGVLAVIAPLKDTPAEKAGIKAADEILSIDGKSTEGMSTDDAVGLIRGESGTTVTFVMLRGKDTLTIPVVRGIIDVPTIDYSLDQSSGVYAISLYTFTANSADLFDKALAAFRASGSHLLLIDLRGDPGGYLDAAVDIGSHFLPKGTLIVTEDYEGNGDNIEHRSLGTGGIPEGTKVAILMDQGSASASEILAGALADNHVATLVGTRSFGKGSVQQLVDLGGGALKVTVARWLTPSGRNISDGGITPDIQAAVTEADVKAGNDTQKKRAIQFLTTGK